MEGPRREAQRYLGQKIAPAVGEGHVFKIDHSDFPRLGKW
jgi:hypothetical protein